MANNYFKVKKVYSKGNKIADSKSEAVRLFQLEEMEKAGTIKDLQKQVKFSLQPSFTRKVWKAGKLKTITIRAMDYTPDFVYFDNEKQMIIVEEHKGFKTEAYKMRAKLFQFKYPQYYFLES